MHWRLGRRVVMAFRSLLRRRTADRELDEELQFHLDQMQEFAASRGEALSDARQHARRQMGSMVQIKEACRQMRTLEPVDQFFRDVRYGARLLARGPGFTVVAVLSLAIGIGASGAIFSLINAIVLRPLPILDPQDLHVAQVTEPSRVDLRFSYPVVEHASQLLTGRAEIAAQSSVEEALVGARGSGVEASAPETARLQLVTGDYFSILRQRAGIGRLLGPDDNRFVGQHPVAVISDQYWRQRFGRDRRVLETELIVNGTPMSVVGVAVPAFFGATIAARTPDVWAPTAMQHALHFAGDLYRTGGLLQQPWPPQSEFEWLEVMVRVPPGGTAAAAEAMTLALRGGNSSDSDTRGARVALLPASGGYSSVRVELTTPLLVLLLMVGLLLAIACANIASLLSARAANRAREMAVRLSMGAGRGRLIRQLLTESLLLASIGGTLGLALAYGGSPALLTLLTPRGSITVIDVRPDWRAIALTFAVSMATALLFGLLPALRGTRVPLATTLRAQTRGVIGAAGHVPIGKVLIAGQMAVTVLLLLVATLFVRSLQALVRVNVGYDRNHVLTARIDPRSAGYTVAELPALYTRVSESLARLPGVVAAGVSAGGLFSGSRNRGDFLVEGYAPAPGEPMVTVKDWVTADYFRTVGLAITQGRGFGPEDSADSRRVTVISETMARRYFHNQSPIGKRWGTTPDFQTEGFEIVGVVEDARYNDVRTEAANIAYMPATQTDRYLGHVAVRAENHPTALTNAVRNALRESEPRLALGAIDTLDSRIDRSISVEKLLGWLTMAFAAAALGLACLGLYGTISYAVRRRTAELGVRIALGADRLSVQWLIVREALLPVLVGGAVGLPFAFLAARAVGGLLYGTAPSDPVAYGAAAGLLVVVSALAAYIPARRASRLDPMVALRTD